MTASRSGFWHIDRLGFAAGGAVTGLCGHDVFGVVVVVWKVDVDSKAAHAEPYSQRLFGKSLVLINSPNPRAAIREV